MQTWASSLRADFEARLKELVEIPTVSALPAHRKDIDRGADAAVAFLKGLGASAERVKTPGHPVVFGRFHQNSKLPTITVYNHLDVQPANEPQWIADPFVMRINNGRYYGRGTTDDKGPALTAAFAARHAVQRGVPVNINFVWELEEEIGSPCFEHFVRKALPRLKTDSVVVSDTIWIARGKPAIPYGLRGLLPLRITLQTGTKDTHSGLVGGAARNPLTELCQLIAECCDARTGRVRIPGFYKDVAAASKLELAGFVASGFTVKKFKAAHELIRLRSEKPKEVLERIWALPTFEVHGITGGYTGPGVKTAVPPVAEAKISMRLVPNQDPARVLRLVRAFIKKRNPDAQVQPESGLKPFIGPRTGPYATAAISAMESAFGRSPALVREGGSIGAVVTMQNYLKCPIIFLGLSLPEHGYHAPNENYDWEQAAGGMHMFDRYFEEVSRL